MNLRTLGMSTALPVLAVLLIIPITVAAVISPALVFGVLAALVVVILTAMKPMIGVAVWIAVLVAIPDWTPVPGGLKPIGAVGVVVLVGLLLSRRRARSGFAWPDFALLGAAALIALWVVLGSYPLVLLTNLVGMILVSYIVGRSSPDLARRAYAYAMIAVAVWGLLEAATRVHVFESWAMSTNHHWNEIQTRAGVDRSEAGFGHAIAYGAALAMAIPFARDLPKHSVIAQTVLLAGIIVSFSRGPILAAALTLGLAVVFATKGRKRLGSIAFFAVTLIVVFFAFQFLYGEDDSATTQQSGDQRIIQLLLTLPHVQWFGSESISVEDGRVSGLGSTIIDNTFLRLAINFGWIVAAMILAPLLYALLNLFRGRVTASSIALIGQIPVLAVTTLITQWQAAVFFIAGIAISELLALNRAKGSALGARAAERRPVTAQRR